MRALAVLALALGLGCDQALDVPPLPLEAEAWRADVEELRWEGALPDGSAATVTARRAQLAWTPQGPAGDLHDLRLRLESPPLELQARRGQGRPQGPLQLWGVSWEAQDALPAGALDEARWDGEGRWSCGGCALESLVGELGLGQP